MASLPHHMLLHGGGLRSLVALARLLDGPERVRVTPLFIHDGRDAAAQRLEHVHRQADHYQLKRVDELHLPHLFRGAGAAAQRTPDGLPTGALTTPAVLLTALGHAAEQRAEAVTWPLSCRAEPAATARATEQRILCTQLAGCEFADVPRLEAPLLWYTDRQVIELGAGLGVPWEASWSCAAGGSVPCRTCPACRRRSAAFRAAGVVDPAVDADAASRSFA